MTHVTLLYFQRILSSFYPIGNMWWRDQGWDNLDNATMNPSLSLHCCTLCWEYFLVLLCLIAYPMFVSVLYVHTKVCAMFKTVYQLLKLLHIYLLMMPTLNSTKKRLVSLYIIVLFFRSSIHYLQGHPESGKMWMTLIGQILIKNLEFKIS